MGLGSLHPKRWLVSWGRHRDIILLASLTCFLVGVTVIWLVLDREPPWWDDGMYLAKSLVMFDALVEGGLVGFIKQFFSVFENRAPLITVLPTPFYLALGRNPRYAFAVNLLFVPILLASVYLIGSRFWNRRAGLIAAYVVGTMPLIYGLTRWYLVEFALTALVSFTILLAIESQEFQRTWVTICLGIVCGLGLLLKVTFPLFILFPFLHISFRFVASGKSLPLPEGSRRPSRLKPLVALILPPALLALPWYIRNFRGTLGLVEFAGFSPDADTYGTGYVFSINAVKTYLLALAGSGTSYYYVLLAIVLAGLILITGKIRSFYQSFSTEPFVILSLWALPFLLFLFGRNKNLRYIAPLLPVFGLILAFALDFVLRMSGKWQIPLLCMVLISPAISLLQKSFAIFGDRVSTLNRVLCVGGAWEVVRKYQRADWPLEEILNTLYRRAKFESGKKKTVMLGTDRAYFNASNFEVAALHNRLPFEIIGSAHSEDLGPLLRSLDSASFFIYKEGGEPESPFYNPHQAALIREVQGNGKFVELPYHWSLPDGGSVRVFENLTPGWPIVRDRFIPFGVEQNSNCEVNFDSQIALTGLSIEQTQTVVRVKYRWLCLEPPDREYWCFTHLVDGQNKKVGFLDHPILGGEPPMRTWKKGDVAIEEVQFPIAPSQSQKRLRLLIGLYHVPSGQRLTIRSFFVSGTSHASLADDHTALLINPGSQSNGRRVEPLRLLGTH